MKELKTYIISGIIFVSILGSLFHFAYQWSGNNLFVGFFTPINESTWEHMKLLFFPMLLFSALKNKKLTSNYPFINSAMSVGILSGTFLIPIIFYTYSGILGFNIAAIDISIFFLSVIFAFFLVWLTADSQFFNKHKNVLNMAIIIVAVMFVVFTVSPPNIALFLAP